MKHVDRWENEHAEKLRWYEALGSYLYWQITGRLPIWHEIRIAQNTWGKDDDNG